MIELASELLRAIIASPSYQDDVCPGSRAPRIPPPWHDEEASSSERITMQRGPWMP